MAFYADIYGYIAIKKGRHIQNEIIEQISKNNQIFKPCLSQAIEGKSSSYISFACSVKIDEGEDNIWLTPFEELLKLMDFLNATVNIVHEESGSIMMYTYIMNEGIKKISSTLVEKFIEEISI